MVKCAETLLHTGLNAALSPVCAGQDEIRIILSRTEFLQAAERRQRSNSSVERACAALGRRIGTRDRRSRQSRTRGSKKQLQQTIMSHSQSAHKDCSPDRDTRNFYLVASGVVEMPIDLAQGQYRQSDRPQTKVSYADLLARNEQCIMQRVFQMSMSDPYQALNAALKLRRVFSASQPTQLEMLLNKNLPRQPTGAVLVILPHVFQNIGH